MVENVLHERKGKTVVWVLSRPEFADRFDIVLVMERGRLVEHGAFAELKRNRMSLEQEVNPSGDFIFAKIQPAMQKLLCSAPSD